MEAAERDAAVVVTPGLGEGGVLHLAGATAGRGRIPRSTRRGGHVTRGDREDSKSVCTVCGATEHTSTECRYRKYVCGKCRQVGHLRRMCSQITCRTRSGQGHNQYQLAADMQEEAEISEGSTSELEEELHQLCLNSYKVVSLLVNIDDVKLPMEIDTGSLVSCISKETYARYFNNHFIEKSNITLKVYNGSKIFPLGIIKPLVKYGDVQKKLELFVIEGGTTSLLGRQWLAELQISLPPFTVNNMSNGNKQLNDVIHRFEDLFTAGLGRFKGSKARLRVREGAVPVFCRARPLPYALRERVDAELDAIAGSDINIFLNTFLLNYRNTEHCSTGETPASLMLGRRVRTKMDALRPDVGSRVKAAQGNQKFAGPSGCREYRVGDEIWLRQYGGSDKWVAGRVVEKMGVSDYKVVDTRGREWHKHVDQLRDQKHRPGVSVLGAPESAASVPKTLVSNNTDQSQSPAGPTASEPIQPRPVRQCRMLNIPRYKF
ncbi:hypothetical protein ACJJTC_005234 [Scirpophaga incertulas]